MPLPPALAAGVPRASPGHRTNGRVADDPIASQRELSGIAPVDGESDYTILALCNHRTGIWAFNLPNQFRMTLILCWSGSLVSRTVAVALQPDIITSEEAPCRTLWRSAPHGGNCSLPQPSAIAITECLGFFEISLRSQRVYLASEWQGGTHRHGDR
jgi:hypothetical protein